MAEPMTEENASGWYDDTPITDEQYASVWDSAMAVQERPSYSRHVVRKLLAKVDRLRTESAYMREQIKQQAQVIEERKTQTVAYRALAEQHQKRGDKLSEQLAEIGETKAEWAADGPAGWMQDPTGFDSERFARGIVEQAAEQGVAVKLMSRLAGEWREVPDA